MNATREPRPVPRLTRSIDRLFRALEGDADDATEGAGSGAEGAPEPTPAPGASAAAATEPADTAPTPAATQDWRPPTGGILGKTVDEYLDAEGGRRDGLSRRIRDRAETLRQADDLNSLADAVEALASAGRSGNGDEASLALARFLASPPVAERLVERLGEAREEVHRRRLLDVAVALKEEMAGRVVQALRDAEDRTARRNYVEALAAMGRQGMAKAVRMTRDSRWFVVRNGVVILGEIANPAVTEHLLRTLEHDDPRVRRESLLALAKLQDERSSDAIFESLNDPDSDVRTAAARAAGLLGTVRAVRPLMDRLEREEDQDVQISILRALGRLRDPTAISVLEKKATGKLFSRPPSAIRAAAYRALGAIGTPRARELLETGAKDRDEEVRAAARRAMVVKE